MGIGLLFVFGVCFGIALTLLIVFPMIWEYDNKYSQLKNENEMLKKTNDILCECLTSDIEIINLDEVLED